MATSKPINIRVRKDEKQWLLETAELNGQTLSEFLRSSAVREAYRVLGPPKIVAKAK